MNTIYQILESLNSVGLINEQPVDDKLQKDIEDCQGDLECIKQKQHPHHRNDDDDEFDYEAYEQDYLPRGINHLDKMLLHTFDYAPWIPAAGVILNVALGPGRNWAKTYPSSIIPAMYAVAREIAEKWITTASERNAISVKAQDGKSYWVPDTSESEKLFKVLYRNMPPARRYWEEEMGESVDINNEIVEGAATVFSDANGHHLKNADGEVVQSFDKTPEGLRAARNALYKDYNILSMEKPKESTMNEYEEKFNAALNESLTITTTAGTDQPDNVSVNATDEDAHTLVAILKAAGLPYKEREAQLAATPCGEQVEEEYSNEPEEKTMSVDYMVNQLSGGLGKQQKMYRKEYPGDNAMAVNEENLMRGLWDLYKKV
jgi:hypothetical protein